MPVECAVEIKEMEQDRFHDLDTQIMRHVFDIHNAMGRFFDEKIYQEELAQRCRKSGFQAQREVELRVTHGSFSKKYLLDLLVEAGSIYELKTLDHLTRGNEGQLINYLLLAGLKHGKLVNFRPNSIQAHFVSTTLRRRDRTAFKVMDPFWIADEASSRLRDTLMALADDWGLFLDGNLYKEALLHFMNGPQVGTQPVQVTGSDRIVGTQKMNLLTPHTAWHLSTVRHRLQFYETHITRLLKHTPLERIHWINLNQHDIQLKTLTR